MDGTEGPEAEKPGMDLSAFCQLQQRRRQLAGKTARLTGTFDDLLRMALTHPKQRCITPA